MSPLRASIVDCTVQFQLSLPLMGWVWVRPPLDMKIERYISQSRERAPTPYLWTSFLYRVRISTHPAASITCLISEHHGVWEAHPQALCISEVRNFVLNFTEGYYKATLNKRMWLKLCLHSAIQSVVCHQNLTSKPLVSLLYIIICFEPSSRA